MTWLTKLAGSDLVRIQNNLKRLIALKKKVHDLSYFVMSSQSGGYQVLKDLLDEKIVVGRPYVHSKLTEALTGENNQKLALDSPSGFQEIMIQAVKLIQSEIGKEKKELLELGVDDERKN